MRYPALLVVALSFCASALVQPQSASSIRRLDGSSISVADADAVAKKTLAAAHVTGAQIAVLNNGRLVWSAAYGLRHKDSDLPMDAQTTTPGASVSHQNTPPPPLTPPP